MTYESIIEKLVQGAAAAKDAAPAAGGVVVTTLGGTAIGLPPWLIGLGQAAVVVIFTLRGIDKRNAALNEKVEELQDSVMALRARVRNLSCQSDTEVTDPCRVIPPKKGG